MIIMITIIDRMAIKNKKRANTRIKYGLFCDETKCDIQIDLYFFRKKYLNENKINIYEIYLCFKNSAIKNTQHIYYVTSENFNKLKSAKECLLEQFKEKGHKNKEAHAMVCNFINEGFLDKILEKVFKNVGL